MTVSRFAYETVPVATSERSASRRATASCLELEQFPRLMHLRLADLGERRRPRAADELLSARMYPITPAFAVHCAPPLLQDSSRLGVDTPRPYCGACRRVSNPFRRASRMTSAATSRFQPTCELAHRSACQSQSNRSTALAAAAADRVGSASATRSSPPGRLHAPARVTHLLEELEEASRLALVDSSASPLASSHLACRWPSPPDAAAQPQRRPGREASKPSPNTRRQATGRHPPGWLDVDLSQRAGPGLTTNRYLTVHPPASSTTGSSSRWGKSSSCPLR